MNTIDVRSLSSRLHRIESVAWIPTVLSTNEIGRRVAIECIDNEIPFPSALIVAGEQLGGRGRGDRRWFSPAGGGIYVTLLHTRELSELALLPLEISLIVADFLTEVYGLEPRVKWPNDLLADGRKIGGIRIDARNQGDNAFLSIGIGINVQRLGSDAPPNATSITDAGHQEGLDTDTAIEAFAEFLDDRLNDPPSPEEILERWTALSIHQTGDPIEVLAGDRLVRGRWDGIDSYGRAILIRDGETVTISAGDLIESANGDEPDGESSD